MFYLRMIFILLFFVSCSMVDPNKEIKGSMDRSGQRIEITTHIFATQRELLDHIESMGLSEHNYMGLSTWMVNENICNIFVIMGEGEFETWGHELAHCLYGTFHKEPTEPQ
jgi:hypothetical protein